MSDITFQRYITPSVLRSSPTLSVGEAGKAVKAAGRDIVSFGAGELEITPTPEMMAAWEAKRAADAQAHPDDAKFKPADVTVKGDKNKYSPTGGTDGLRAAAAWRFAEDTGMDVTVDHVAVASGAKAVLNGVLKQVHGYRDGKNGDTFIVWSPGWPTNYDMYDPGVELIVADTGGRGIPTPEQVTGILKQFPNTRGMSINAPCNPTGADYTPEEREAVLAAIRSFVEANNRSKEDFMLVWDDPYGKISFVANPSQKRGENEKSLYASGHLVHVKSLSKEYGLPGERIGYVVSVNPAAPAAVKKFNENKSTVAGNTSQDEAQLALLYGDDFVQATIADLKPKRQALIDGIREIAGATIDEPGATLYGWPDFSGLKGKVIPANSLIGEQPEPLEIDSPQVMMRYFRECAGLNAVPGEPFYPPGSELGQADWHLRMSFAGDGAVTEKALATLKDAIGKLQEKNSQAA